MRPDLPEAGKRMWQLYDELEGTVERVAAGARQGVEDAARSVVTLGARGAAFVGREYGRTQARFDCVYTACEDARSRAKTELVQRFRDIELGQVVDGLLDGLEQMLVTILGCTTGGAVVGGALGAFAWGIGAVPGAAIGASAGLQVGVFALKVMGLAAIVEYVVHALPDALALYKKGLREAWDAPQDPLSGVDRPDHARILHVKAATWLIAEGHVRMVVIILMGIVACLLAKADTAALAKSMEGGSLGEDFSGWVVRNGGKLKARPDLQPRASRILRPEIETGFPESGEGTAESTSLNPEKVAKPPNRLPIFRSDLDDRWFDPDTGELNWPPGNGFDGTPVSTTLQPGTLIDRYGRPGGQFLSPVGTSYEARALPYNQELMPYHTYEVLKPLDVQSGSAASWFDQSGGGTQYITNQPVADLLKNGYLREVTP